MSLSAIAAMMFLVFVGTVSANTIMQSSVTDDQFADSRFPETTSPANNPDGRYLWTGHQERNDVHAYTLMKFDVGENWNWGTAQLILPFNYFFGSEGKTSIWFNPNDNWGSEDVTYGNLPNLWDWENSPLLAQAYVPESNNVVPFSFDVSSLINHETNDIVSLVVGSILPNETAIGNYWRNIVNSDYPCSDYSAKLLGQHVIPEPATAFLLGMGLIGLIGACRLKKT